MSCKHGIPHFLFHFVVSLLFFLLLLLTIILPFLFISFAFFLPIRKSSTFPQSAILFLCPYYSLSIYIGLSSLSFSHLSSIYTLSIKVYNKWIDHVEWREWQMERENEESEWIEETDLWVFLLSDWNASRGVYSLLSLLPPSLSMLFSLSLIYHPFRFLLSIWFILCYSSLI